jgi:hypothetical protein
MPAESFTFACLSAGRSGYCGVGKYNLLNSKNQLIYSKGNDYQRRNTGTVF